MSQQDKVTIELQIGIEKYVWSVESFNERTGNHCKRFKRNYHTGEVIT